MGYIRMFIGLDLKHANTSMCVKQQHPQGHMGLVMRSRQKGRPEYQFSKWGEFQKQIMKWSNGLLLKEKVKNNNPKTPHWVYWVISGDHFYLSVHPWEQCYAIYRVIILGGGRMLLPQNWRPLQQNTKLRICFVPQILKFESLVLTW